MRLRSRAIRDREIQMYISRHTVKYSPPFEFCPFRPRCQRANLRLGEYQCHKLSLSKKQNVWANSRQGENLFK